MQNKGVQLRWAKRPRRSAFRFGATRWQQISLTGLTGWVDQSGYRLDPFMARLTDCLVILKVSLTYSAYF